MTSSPDTGAPELSSRLTVTDAVDTVPTVTENEDGSTVESFELTVPERLETSKVAEVGLPPKGVHALAMTPASNTQAKDKIREFKSLMDTHLDSSTSQTLNG